MKLLFGFHFLILINVASSVNNTLTEIL